ncbi:hypothetical protein Tco_0406165, partial [Tanacetum coccineum]
MESIDALLKDVAAPKSQSQNRDRSGIGSGKHDEGDSSWHHQRYRPHNKIVFPTFSDGDLRGWILKAEEYFRYYDIPKKEKVDVASMHMEGDALDFYSWISIDQSIEYRGDLVRALKSIDKNLCSVKQQEPCKSIDKNLPNMLHK